MLVSFQIFGSEWQDEMVHWRVNSTDYNVVWKFGNGSLVRTFSLGVGFQQDIIIFKETVVLEIRVFFKNLLVFSSIFYLLQRFLCKLIIRFDGRISSVSSVNILFKFLIIFELIPICPQCFLFLKQTWLKISLRHRLTLYKLILTPYLR